MQSNEEIPTLEALRTRDGIQLVVWCKYCVEWHRHGAVGPTLGAGDGHRVAHCVDPDKSSYFHRGYFLKETGPLTKDSQYRISGRKRPRGLGRESYVYLPPA